MQRSLIVLLFNYFYTVFCILYMSVLDCCNLFVYSFSRPVSPPPPFFLFFCWLALRRLGMKQRRHKLWAVERIWKAKIWFDWNSCYNFFIIPFNLDSFNICIYPHYYIKWVRLVNTLSNSIDQCVFLKIFISPSSTWGDELTKKCLEDTMLLSVCDRNKENDTNHTVIQTF